VTQALIDEHHLHADGMRSHAIYSPCQRYRYALKHEWERNGLNSMACTVFLMVNPSSATACATDPTVARCIGYAKRWGMSSVVVLNLFALRSTDPQGLLACEDPCGPENDRLIAEYAAKTDGVVCAWGGPYSPKALGVLVRTRAIRVRKLLAGRLTCLATAKGGEPRHPLYLKSDLLPVEYRWEQ
jgi:hypothetical protein